MKSVIQVVNHAKLYVDKQIISQIERGLVVFFCVEKDDNEEKLQYFSKKIANLRLFSDENGKTNLSVKDVSGEILLVSQFTLAGSCERGNRPSFDLAEKPERAKMLYLKLAKMIEVDYNLPVKLGVFGADMTIEQSNAGPFTIILQK